jgi:hypothetical protein
VVADTKHASPELASAACKLQPPRWSRRAPEALSANTFSRYRDRLGELTDLTQTNPTLCGLEYPTDALTGLVTRGAERYDPDPLGIPSARSAVAAELERHGGRISADRVVLTASTSEAYGLLFKLLCDPGDVVLTPTPSYPLLEHLARLEGVRAVRYRLALEDGWQPELPRGVQHIEPSVKAAVLVHPNNPTGSYLEHEVMAELDAHCARLRMARVVDEVFLPYALTESRVRAGSTAGAGESLTFTLGGLSKACGMPQVKLAWIAVHGVGADAACQRLAFIADQYLSVATPVQHALPSLLAAGTGIRQQIRERCGTNLELLSELTSQSPVQLMPVEGGWSAVLRVPSFIDEEQLVLRLLVEDRVAIYPGYFFDFEDNGWLVVSLLTPAADLRVGMSLLVARLERMVTTDGDEAPA